MEGQTPDIYFTSAQIKVSAFDVLIELVRQTSQEDKELVAKIRTSLGHAKVLAILMSKNIHGVEKAIGSEIAIHPDVLKSLKINLKEDW